MANGETVETVADFILEGSKITADGDFSHEINDAKSWLIWKDPDGGKDWRWEKGMTEDEIVGWHHQLNGHEFE